MDIRKKIADKRALRIEDEGYGLSAEVPERREVPLTSFNNEPFIICEVKRGSPSKGKFAAGLNAVEQARHYYNSGIRQVSVLTEEDSFFGSLNDLMEIKKEFPDLSLLRKDFLLDIKDVEVSYLCGADAILLITSLLDIDRLTAMYNRAVELGMTPLVEVHDREDVEKVRTLKPVLTGINSRDLKTFKIDPLRPLKIRSFIDWETRVIYESGIKEAKDGEFARDAGFSGVLVGEWAVKDKDLSRELVSLFNREKKESPWKKLFKGYREERPFVKICGITNDGDYRLIKELGADLAGFILADSPRRVSPDFIRSLGRDSDILRVGVVVLKEGEDLPGDVIDLINEGYLDFIQFHGDEDNNKCTSYNLPYYKAIRIKDENSLKMLGSYSYADLIDSFSTSSYGGTGKTVDRELTEKAMGSNLWLAGGLKPENIRVIISEFKPGLIDLSSGVEKSPGIKDEIKLRNLFKEIG